MTTPDLPQISDERIKKLIPKCDAWRYEVGHDEAVSFARAIIAERDAQWLTRLGAVAEDVRELMKPIDTFQILELADVINRILNALEAKE